MNTPTAAALFLASAFIGLMAINAAQARSLPAERFGLKVATIATYNRRKATPPQPRRPPPQTQLSSPKSREFTRNYRRLALQPPQKMTSYEGTLISPPKPASPKGQHEIESPYTEEIPCNDGCISMITDLWRPLPGKYTPPYVAPPVVQIALDLERILHKRSPPRQYLVSA
ncbi:unnamed protein product [Dovyalis caffra]|uniref:Uncharacterized protein n=1 Tax=Dovyalis caffra TaxID=77055 RepID=A0AAV1RM85_9ROSI|nr:unnamed protein product [Dovyalis caffra]